VHDGEEVWSRMDSATLRDVADATGGLFVPAATAQVELGEILTRTLADIERTEGDATVARTTSPLFQWPAGLALALLVIESMVSACARRTVPERATVARGMREGKSSTSGIRRTRRTRPQRSAVGATVATAIALAAIPGPGREASAQAQVKDAPRAVDAPPPPAARRADSDTLATDAPRAKRTVGRGQIDRAAFREAVTRANAAMKASQYAEAASAFAEAMDADPTSAAAAYNKGVAEYRAGKLDDASASFSEAATRGDAALAADAMFNQGNATYQSALRALDGAPDESDPAVPAASSSNGAAAQPDLKAATDAVSKALTHYKDAIAANPGDIDSRANAELAHTLLKRLEEMQQKQQQNETQDQDKEQKQDDQEQAEQQQDGGECDNPQQGDGEGKSGGKSSDKSSDDTYPESDKDEQQAKDAGSDQQEQEDPKDKSGAEPSEPKDDQASQDRAGGAEQRDAKDPKGPEGEVKARNGAEQSTADQKPQTPGQARAGEPVPGAPLTKSEAERLLQGVRDRSKQRMEAKERAERVRQVPAVRDW
jgi:Ca-activated chloride channel family protein